MDEEAEMPVLVSAKPLKSEFSHLHKIAINSEQFTVGRNIGNSVVIPFISISRLHCTFHKSENNEWFIKDSSSFGIRINNKKVQKGFEVNISDGDVITFDPTAEFVYKFYNTNEQYEIPKKRIKREKSSDSSIMDNMKVKFEESQNFEMKHIEEKIQNAKHLQNTSMILKEQLQADMDRKTEQLKSDFALQIENLKGEKDEVERQKALLLEERDQRLAQVTNEMEGKISELMEQIQKHNEAESELLKENNLLKEKLAKEREDFLSELSRENSSKQDLLERLEAKIQEQEEIRKKEKEELQEALKKETEELRLAQEKELREVEEQKRLRELELEQELKNMKQKLQEKVEQTEKQKRETEEQLNQKMEQLQKLSEEEKCKVEQLQKEREQIQNQLLQAQKDAEASLIELKQRETELQSIASARIQQQADQSSEVITTLQGQLEKMKKALESVETEKNTLLSMYGDGAGEGTSKQTTLHEVGEIMENELQCSICAELFIEAITLNCSHTFCKYCITMWKRKKKDCPICRAPITAENRSIVLDSFIEKMVQNLTEEMKVKRQDILQYRAELVSEMARQTAGPSRSSDSFDESEASNTDDYLDSEEDPEDEQFERESAYFYERQYHDTYTDSGSDDGASSDESRGGAAGGGRDAEHGTAAGAAPAAPAPEHPGGGRSNNALSSTRATTSNNERGSRSDGAARTDPATTGSSDGSRRGKLASLATGGAASQVSPASTTAGTGAASTAARAATGRPAVPSGSIRVPVEITNESVLFAYRAVADLQAQVFVTPPGTSNMHSSRQPLAGDNTPPIDNPSTSVVNAGPQTLPLTQAEFQTLLPVVGPQLANNPPTNDVIYLSLTEPGYTLPRNPESGN